LLPARLQTYSSSVELEYVWSLAGKSGIKTLPVIVADSCNKPPYPESSRQAHESGTVALRFLVDENGRVVQREFERSSGYERLDNAASAGLALCRFRPAMFNGKPARAWARIEYVWRLQ